jgi:serine/threonine protein kinase
MGVTLSDAARADLGRVVRDTGRGVWMISPARTRAPSMNDPKLLDLLSECIGRMEDEGLRALDEICAREPDCAVALRERVEKLRAAGMLEVKEGSQQIPERLGDFQLVRRIAAGGMGVVYEAQQVSLGRRVALKLIRPEMLYFPGARERFRREVDAVARLGHAGIAQIHAVGEENGVPYFAMEYVDGAALSHVVTDVADRAPSLLRGVDLRRSIVRRSQRESGVGEEGARLFTGSWAEACIRIVQRACEIVAAAHDAGILHRDLKPSNILVTPSGRVVVVDFGLALLQGSERLTRTGSQLGSLPYMAPEQLRADVAHVGPATDVYALGVTLYELLTLQLPFLSESASGLELEISAGQPRSPRALNSSVGRDLETVVLAALSSRPNKRYAGPRELAQDLEHVLVHRPIRARRVRAFGRGARWCRRHPASALGIALGAALAIGVPSLWAWSETRLREAVQSERDEAVLERRRAETYLDIAMKSSDLLLQRASTRSAVDVPALIERTLESLGELAATPGVGGPLEVHRARLFVALGDTLRTVGRPQDAEAAYQRVAALYRERCELEPSENAWKLHFAISTNSWGAALADLGRREQALEQFETAMHACDALEVDPAYAARALQHFVGAATNRARLLQSLGRDAEYRESTQLAARAAERVLSGEATPKVRADAAMALLTRADMLQDAEGVDAALDEYRRTLDVLERAVADDGERSTLREQLAGAAMTIGSNLTREGRVDDAEPVLSRARALFEALCEEVPDSAWWPVQLAEVLFVQGMVADMRGDQPQAARLLQRMLEMREGVVQRFPGDLVARQALGSALFNAAQFALVQGDNENALRHADRALETFAALGDEQRASAEVRFNLSAGGLLRARALVATSRVDDALTQLEELEHMTVPPPLHLELAHVWALLSVAASPVTPRDGRDAAAHAVAWLGDAVKSGAIPATMLAEDPELEALRSRADFQALLGGR